MDIRLRPLRSDEFDAFLQAAGEEYTDDLARARGPYHSLGYAEVAVEMTKRL